MMLVLSLLTDSEWRVRKVCTHDSGLIYLLVFDKYVMRYFQFVMDNANLKTRYWPDNGSDDRHVSNTSV